MALHIPGVRLQYDKMGNSFCKYNGIGRSSWTIKTVYIGKWDILQQASADTPPEFLEFDIKEVR